MRNSKFDILKSIALICIILAHINPGDYLMQLRNFDVILMIIVSVLLSVKSIELKSFSYKKYLIKRMKRLIVPTWCFLSVYFIFQYFTLGSIDIKSMILSYSLIGGIGYVWIIRIYIYVAIITPLINKLANIVGVFKYYIIVIGIYLVYEILIKLDYKFSSPYINIIFRASVLDFIGYSLIVFLVIGIKKMRKKEILLNMVIFFGVLCILAMRNDFTYTQDFKYPLKLYFVSYSMLMSLGIYMLVNKYMCNFKWINKTTNYLSSNSMGIYLWHIIYISPINRIFKFNNVLLRLFIILILAIITDYLIKIFLVKFNNIKKQSFLKNSVDTLK